jgi:hypothetical protein
MFLDEKNVHLTIVKRFNKKHFIKVDENESFDLKK